MNLERKKHGFFSGKLLTDLFGLRILVNFGRSKHVDIRGFERRVLVWP